MAPTPKFQIVTEGFNTLLKCDGEPIARFYAGRTTQAQRKLIERKLNTEELREFD